jgi:hypothetical protein
MWKRKQEGGEGQVFLIIVLATRVKKTKGLLAAITSLSVIAISEVFITADTSHKYRNVDN